MQTPNTVAEVIPLHSDLMVVASEGIFVSTNFVHWCIWAPCMLLFVCSVCCTLTVHPLYQRKGVYGTDESTIKVRRNAVNGVNWVAITEHGGHVWTFNWQTNPRFCNLPSETEVTSHTEGEEPHARHQKQKNGGSWSIGSWETNGEGQALLSGVLQ